MKKLFVLLLGLVTTSSFAMTDKAQKELEQALGGDYQALRNVAYSMKDGSSGHDRNPIAGCALRKIIILTQPEKRDTGDFSNEYVDCKALSPSDAKTAWEMTLKLLGQ